MLAVLPPEDLRHERLELSRHPDRPGAQPLEPGHAATRGAGTRYGHGALVAHGADAEGEEKGGGTSQRAKEAASGVLSMRPGCGRLPACPAGCSTSRVF